MGWRRFVLVDSTVGSESSSSLLWSLVDLDVRNVQLGSVQTFSLLERWGLVNEYRNGKVANAVARERSRHISPYEVLKHASSRRRQAC